MWELRRIMQYIYFILLIFMSLLFSLLILKKLKPLVADHFDPSLLLPKITSFGMIVSRSVGLINIAVFLRRGERRGIRGI